MAIRYYPNRVYRARVPKVDRDMATKEVLSVSGHKDVAATALDVTISSDTSWKFHAVDFEFSTATARDYSVNVKNGRKVVENLNDYMWFGHSTSGVKMITLPSGFYTGTELAAELQTQLNTEFSPITWTVAYVSITGLFTITPSAGTVRYLNVNTSAQLSKRDSIGGHLLGFEVNAASAAAISSDTAIYGLDLETELYAIIGGVLLSDNYSAPRELSIDQAIKLASSVASVEISYITTYEKSVNGEPYVSK